MLRREPPPVKWGYLDEKGNKSEKQDHVCKKVNSELRALETSSDQTDSARERRLCQELENRPSTSSPDCEPAHVWCACNYDQSFTRDQSCRGTAAAGRDQPPCSRGAPSDPFSAFPDEKPCWVYCYGDSGTCQHIYSNFQNVKPILCSCGTLGKFQPVCLEMNETLQPGDSVSPSSQRLPAKTESLDEKRNIHHSEDDRGGWDSSSGGDRPGS